MPEIQNYVWPLSPSYENPIIFIESSKSDANSPFFNFQLHNLTKTKFRDENDVCEKVSNRIANVKKVTIY